MCLWIQVQLLVDSRVEDISMWTQNLTLHVEHNLWIQAISLLRSDAKAMSSSSSPPPCSSFSFFSLSRHGISLLHSLSNVRATEISIAHPPLSFVISISLGSPFLVPLHSLYPHLRLLSHAEAFHLSHMQVEGRKFLLSSTRFLLLHLFFLLHFLHFNLFFHIFSAPSPPFFLSSAAATSHAWWNFYCLIDFLF